MERNWLQRMDVQYSHNNCEEYFTGRMGFGLKYLDCLIDGTKLVTGHGSQNRIYILTLSSVERKVLPPVNKTHPTRGSQKVAFYKALMGETGISNSQLYCRKLKVCNSARQTWPLCYTLYSAC
jgi:hypothetical protein